MNNPFDRANVAVRERPDSFTLNRAQSQADRSLRDTLQAIYSARSLTSAAGTPYSGFVGDGFRLVPTSPAGLAVQVTAGFGFQYVTTDLPSNIGDPDLVGVDDRSAFKPMYLLAPAVFAVPQAPPAGMSRIDIIEARFDRRLEDATTRRVLDASTKDFLDKTILKTLAFALDGRVGFVNSPSPSTAAVSYKIGAAAATGSELSPSTTAGYVQIGRINVGPTVTTINSTDLADKRKILAPGGVLPFGARWRLQWNGGSPIVTTLAINCPPSVQVSMVATNGFRGSGFIYATGGDFSSGTIVTTAIYVANSGGFGFLLNGLGDAADESAPHVASSSDIPVINVGTPPLSVGVGTSFYDHQFNSIRIQNTGTIDNNSSSLEDVIIQVSGTMAYRV